jgi:hypothetical protein
LRNTNDELVPGPFIFIPGFRDKKVPVENETWSNAESVYQMDWDNEQICHLFRLTAVGLGEYVQVFRGMFVKLGITGKESAVSLFLLVRERGGPRFKFNFYFLGGGHLKYLYLCGGTPKIIKILVVVPQIIDGVPNPPPRYFFLEKPSDYTEYVKQHLID